MSETVAELLVGVLEQIGVKHIFGPEHPFGTIKCWMGATHFLVRCIRKVSTEMALNVLAYNMKRVIAIVGVSALLAAMTTT
jgi:hypothetical protein